MRRFLGVVVSSALLLPAGLTACGIPNETEVRVGGKLPVTNTGAGQTTGWLPPTRDKAGGDPATFALNFLKAAAGEAAGVYDRVNGYIDPEAWLNKKPPNEVAVNIVRLVEDAPEITVNNDGTRSVKINVQQVGVLRSDGSVVEPVETAATYTFKVGQKPVDAGKPGPGPGLYVLDPPQVLLMTTDALTIYYKAHTIYFWNAEGNALVPDLRYLPLTVPQVGRATMVIRWLTGGPSDWLGATAVKLPEGASVKGNVPAPDGNPLEVNLEVKAGALDSEATVDRLFTQVVWSLQEESQLLGDLPDDLTLKIQDQTRKVANVADWRQRNPVYQVTSPTRFGVLGGKIYPLSAEGATPSVPIAGDANHDIVSAGLSRVGGRIWAALVTATGGGRQLLTGAGADPVRGFTTSRAYRSMGRPVWLKESEPDKPVGLVVAEGRLYRFDAGRDNASLTQVPLPGASGAVTSVGSALDGHRIAFIAGGALYVAVVSTDGGAVRVGPARRLVTSLRNLTAVDWSGENWLAVAGLLPNGRTAIVRLSVDGVLETPPEDSDVGATVTYLAAYPDNPMIPASGNGVLYEANQVGYAAGEPIPRERVMSETPLPTAPDNPTAPFYLY